MFLKKGVFQKRKFSFPFVRRQIYFSPIFLKSWVHISDNIAGVVGGSQYNYRGYRLRDFLLPNNNLDDVFIFKDLLGLEINLTKNLL